MRTLRLSLAGAVILALLGLLGVGPVTTADGQCQPEKSTADLVADQAKAKAELDAANDEVADLLLKLRQAGLRQQAAQAKLEEATRCLDAKDDADKKAKDLPGRTTRTTTHGYVVPAGDDIAYVVECETTRDRDGAVFHHKAPAQDFEQLDDVLGWFCLKVENSSRVRTIVVVSLPSRQPNGEVVPAGAW